MKKTFISLPLSDIKPYENNPRDNEDAVPDVKRSIEECGYCDPIEVDENNVILSGHTRYLALKELNYNVISVVQISGLNEWQKKKYRILANKTAEAALWDFGKLKREIENLDFSAFDFDFNFDFDDIDTAYDDDDEIISGIDKTLNPRSMQNNAFENQEIMQFSCDSFYGIPEIKATQTTGAQFLRFMDWKEVNDPENYIAHFYYDDYKFMSAWREPNKYIERLKKFKAVISPDFSLYTDFPRALQILSCYRRNWCGAYWQYLGIDVIPDVVWGDKDSFEYCFDGLPKKSTVAISSVGVKRDNKWNNKSGDMFKAGYDEMLKRIEPTTVLFYGDMIDGLEGNIIQIPSYYAQKREYLNERKKTKNGARN